MTSIVLPEYCPDSNGDASLHIMVRFENRVTAEKFQQQFFGLGNDAVLHGKDRKLLTVQTRPGPRIDWYLQKLTVMLEKFTDELAGNESAEIVDTRLVTEKDRNDCKKAPDVFSCYPDLQFDSGKVFGSGTHPSTGLVIQAIEDVSEGRELFFRRVLDIGCGSGILSLLCALKGADAVLGIDISTEALEIARQNIIDNRLEALVRVSDTRLEDIQDTFDLVLANLTVSVLLRYMDEFRGKLNSGGVLIASGMQGRQGEVVKEMCLQRGFEELRSYQSGKWRAQSFRFNCQH
ncbi:MAG: 50S ribosomal protein L11 methyltransferase [Proteobacteria bacterium]|nr:50S ribosomal protein L11 methyltransferase [Pseudomonadota bacterium]MBU1708672.1 50S ribosomal protein L11 methyltransferase [Pseudomonadota bacterium]